MLTRLTFVYKYTKIGIIALLVVYMPSLGATITTFHSIQYGVVALDAGRVPESIAWYNRAVAADPKSVIALRGLARARLAAGDVPAALVALEDAWRLRPDSLLVQRELAEAYFLSGQCDTAAALWMRAGVLPQQVLDIVERFIRDGDYQSAARWLDRYFQLQPAPDDTLLFRFGRIVALSNGAVQFADLPPDLQDRARSLVFRPLTPVLRVEAETLRTVAGQPVVFTQYPSLAVLWSASEAGHMLIDIPKSRTYAVRLRAQHGPLPPIDLSLELNNRPVNTWSFMQGDGTWEEKEIMIELPAGLHVLAVRFISDSIGTTDNPNALLDWLDIREARP